MHNKSRRIYEKIANDVKFQLKQSHFYQEKFLVSMNRCLGSHRKIENIICYGLGSFHNGVDIVSRYQLALLLLIYDHLLGSGNPINEQIDVYDPSFEDLDKETLKCFSGPRFNILEQNEYCGRDLAQCGSGSNHSTLIYMPHLDKYLYNNLLGSNWFVGNMKKLVILGNSFQEMIDNEIPSKCRSELYYINALVTNFELDSPMGQNSKKRKKILDKKSHQIGPDYEAKALVEIKIDDSIFEHGDIFNNLAFHSISQRWLEENSSKLDSSRLNNWDLATPPVTDDDTDWPA